MLAAVAAAVAATVAAAEAAVLCLAVGLAAVALAAAVAAAAVLAALAAALATVTCCSYRCCFNKLKFLPCLGSRAGVILRRSVLGINLFMAVGQVSGWAVVKCPTLSQPYCRL